MIDKTKILSQLESLEAQRRGHENDICAINGCVTLCQAWLAELDEEEAVRCSGQPKTAAEATEQVFADLSNSASAADS